MDLFRCAILSVSKWISFLIFCCFVEKFSCKTGSLIDDPSIGAWRLTDEVPIVFNGFCTVERINSDNLTQEIFLEKFAFSKPVIIENLKKDSSFHDKCRKSLLLNEWGDFPVILSSANTYSYSKVTSTLRNYVQNMKPQIGGVLGNETYYLFGDIEQSIWKPLLDLYRKPKYRIPGYEPALSFGIAAVGTGVPFHFHGPGFAEVIHGSKIWFLYPYGSRPDFNPDVSTLDWYMNQRPGIEQFNNPLLECLLKPGEVIYFPDKWWHATLNAETSVFVSTFLSKVNNNARMDL